jgi:hypothetical protein
MRQSAPGVTVASALTVHFLHHPCATINHFNSLEHQQKHLKGVFLALTPALQCGTTSLP